MWWHCWTQSKCDSCDKSMLIGDIIWLAWLEYFSVDTLSTCQPLNNVWCPKVVRETLRPGTPVLKVIFNKYLIFEFSTGNSFLLLGL